MCPRLSLAGVLAALAIAAAAVGPAVGTEGISPPLCDLTGHWRWGASKMDIAIVMTGPAGFEVTLNPDQDWHNATGRFQQLYNGTAVVQMVGAPGNKMVRPRS